MSRLCALPLILAACTAGADGDDDTDDTDDTDGPGGWQTLAEDTPGALLSVTGTGTDDVWIVGADGGDGPEAHHFDGTAWTALEVDSPGDLWWVWRGPEEVAWFAGEGGRVVRYDLATDEAAVEVLDPDVTLFGIWGATEDDLWAVGGNIALSTNGAAVFHRVGSTWTEVDLPENAASKFAMYKLWGTASDDVWMCGIGGAVAHWEGSAWADVASDTDRDLFTLAGGGATEIYAVGGIASAAIIGWDGTAWADESPDFGPQFNGVHVGVAGPVAAGRTGEIWRRADDGTWSRDARGIASFKDFHAVWTDPEGGLWAVGGKLSSNTEGTLVYGGSTEVPAIP